MSKNLDNSNDNTNISEEIPVIINKTEESSSSYLSNSGSQIERSEQNRIYRWNANDEANFKSNNNGNYNDKSNAQNFKKPKNNFGIKIFAAIMSLMFVASASFAGILVVNQLNENNRHNSALVLSNKDAIEETKNNNSNDKNVIEDTAITIPENTNTNSSVLTIEQAIAKVNPSVVCIQTESLTDYGDYGGFGGFFGGGGGSSEPYTVQGVGTGFIVSDDGYIATNYHVVQDANKITVTLFNGETYEAEFIGGDEGADLAVIKIDAKSLAVAEFGNSDALVIGNEVIAIGTPAGIEFGWSATRGIVSAVARGIEINSRKTMTVIQTDASINPGNSGGPLINMKGQVIGINSMKLASTQYEGMGFAIPINGAIEVLNDIIANPGIKQDPSTTDLSEVSFGITGQTVYDEVTGKPLGWKIATITEGGPCDGSGLQPSDIIIALDGTAVATTEDLYALKRDYKPGDEATVTILRNGDTYDFTIILAEKPVTQE